MNQERRLARKASSNEEQRSPVIFQGKTKKLELEGSSGVLYSKDTAADSAVNGSQTDGSEKEASRSESSFDADSEASESESASKQTAFGPSGSNASALHISHVNVKMPHSKPSDSNDETISSAMSKLSFCDTIKEDKKLSRGDTALGLSNNSMFSVDKPLLSQNPQNAFQTLSQSYITSSKECSVQSCLYQFTSVELLMGNNKLLCESCTERKQKYQKKTISTGKCPCVCLDTLQNHLSKPVPLLLCHCYSLGLPAGANHKMSPPAELACNSLKLHPTKATKLNFILQRNHRCNLDFIVHLYFIQDK